MRGETLQVEHVYREDASGASRLHVIINADDPPAALEPLAFPPVKLTWPPRRSSRALVLVAAAVLAVVGMTTAVEHRPMEPRAVAPARAIVPHVVAVTRHVTRARAMPAPFYIVRPGDSLWTIARRTLGDPARWPELRRLNRALLRHPNSIDAGWRLRLPATAT